MFLWHPHWRWHAYSFYVCANLMDEMSSHTCLNRHSCDFLNFFLTEVCVFAWVYFHLCFSSCEFVPFLIRVIIFSLSCKSCRFKILTFFPMYDKWLFLKKNPFVFELDSWPLVLHTKFELFCTQIVLYSNVFSFWSIYLTKLALGAGHSPLYVFYEHPLIWSSSQPYEVGLVCVLHSPHPSPSPHTILRWGNQVEKKKFRTLIKVTRLVCGEVRIQTSSQATKRHQL